MTNILQAIIQALINPQARDVLIEALQKLKQQAADDAVLRDVVADNRGDFYKFSPPAPVAERTERVETAPSWPEPSKTEQLAFNRMLNQQEAEFRAELVDRLSKVEGGR